MSYYNHGHTEIKAVNQLYKGIETPDDLYEALLHCWTRETCTARLRNKYSESNKTAGQCAITAFLVQDIFGGEIRELDTGRGLHCYNVIDGVAIDLTSEEMRALSFVMKIILCNRHVKPAWQKPRRANAMSF